MSSKGSTWQRH